MTRRILPIAFIFIASWMAWAVLAGVMDHRSVTKGASMRDAVGGLWGSVHSQQAPELSGRWSELGRYEMTDAEKASYREQKQAAADERSRLTGSPARVVTINPEELVEVRRQTRTTRLPISAQRIDVDFDLDYRKKGLLWFSTYSVHFDASYATKNPLDREVRASIRLPFPANDAVYDGVVATVAGREDVTFDTVGGALVAELDLAPGQAANVRFAYSSRGQDEWRYSFGDSTETIRGLDLTMVTDFDAIDFPDQTISPDSKERTGDGWALGWKKDSMVSGAGVGMVFPKRINPGPFASAISSSAPISLFFFFFVVFILQTLHDIKLHPMHYFFFAASFFSFNLLFAYSVAHLAIVPAFILSVAVSLVLVIPYTARAVSPRFALLGVAPSQIVYQGVFGVAHFFDGYTGLTVTLGAVATLGTVMHLTAKVDWQERFVGRPDIAEGPGDLAIATSGAPALADA